MNAVAREVKPWGIVVAGGSGARYGGLKQLAVLGGRRVLDHSLSALRTVCAGVVVVVPPDRIAEVVVDDAEAVVGGGETRSASVRSGLAAIGPDATHVLVHDAARPLASPALCRRVVDALSGGADAAIPVVEVTDSLRTVDGKPVDRSGFVAVQTPQGFDVEVLREAHRSGEEATDDATLVDRLGCSVAHVKGDPMNLKITEPHDLRLAQELLDGR